LKTETFPQSPSEVLFTWYYSRFFLPHLSMLFLRDDDACRSQPGHLKR